MSKINPEKNDSLLDDIIKRGDKLKDAACFLGVGPNTVKSRIESSGRLKEWRRNRYYNVNAIKKATSNGERSLEALANIAHCKPNGFLTKYSSLIDFPDDLIPYRNNPEIDTLIDRGLTLEKIGQNLQEPLTPQRIRQYIEETAQYGLWSEKRTQAQLREIEEREQLPFERQTLIGFIYNYGKEKAKDQGFAYEKAWEYYFEKIKKGHKKGPHKTISFDELVKLYSLYEKLHAEENFTYRLLNDKLGFSKSTIRLYLSSVGLSTGKINVRLEKQQFRLVKRAKKVAMNSLDIGYFIGIDPVTIRPYFDKSDERRPQYRLSFGRFKLTSYRVAAQLYEALDLRFNGKECIELLDLREEEFLYLKRNREKIEEKIIKDLNYIYKRDNIIKAYQIPL